MPVYQCYLTEIDDFCSVLVYLTILKLCLDPTGASNSGGMARGMTSLLLLWSWICFLSYTINENQYVVLKLKGRDPLLLLQHRVTA